MYDLRSTITTHKKYRGHLNGFGLTGTSYAALPWICFFYEQKMKAKSASKPTSPQGEKGSDGLTTFGLKKPAKEQGIDSLKSDTPRIHRRLPRRRGRAIHEHYRAAAATRGPNLRPKSSPKSVLFLLSTCGFFPARSTLEINSAALPYFVPW